MRLTYERQYIGQRRSRGLLKRLIERSRGVFNFLFGKGWTLIIGSNVNT